MTTLKKTFRSALQSLVLYQLYFIRAVFGKAFIKMNFRFWSQLASACSVLRVLGATVGKNTHIYSDICVYNMDGYSCRNLSIGSNVYIGPRCVFDLTGEITIEEDVSISSNCSFITHIDVGKGILNKIVKKTSGSIRVKRGTWIGVNTTVLKDVTIGQACMVGAMSLVNKSIPDNSLGWGIPFTVEKTLQLP